MNLKGLNAGRGSAIIRQIGTNEDEQTTSSCALDCIQAPAAFRDEITAIVASLHNQPVIETDDSAEAEPDAEGKDSLPPHD